MKKILLSLTFMCFFALAKSQNVVLNEVYGNPGGSNSEFLELYNSSVTGSLDCYTIMVYYENEGGSAQGWYVLDLPNTPSIDAAPGFFVLAPAGTFSTQGTAGAMADVNWNDINFRNGSTNGYLKKYEWNGSGYTDLNLANNVSVANLLDGTLNGGQFYFVLLFQNGFLINGFIGGGSSNTLSTYAVSLGSLTVPLVGCGLVNDQFTVNFASLGAMEFFNPSGGNDNGYARTADGKCGSWTKTAPQINHTPGSSNGSATGLSGSLTTSQLIVCDVPRRAIADVTGVSGDVTEANDFPVQIHFYNDVNNNQTIDGGDILITTIQQNTVAAAAAEVQLTGQHQNADVIFVYETKRGCFDKVVSVINLCSPLPVHFASFTAKRTNSSSVSLVWQTASELNNSGFEVQRNVNGNWETVIFIPTQAAGGNSDALLTYYFTDMNSAKGMSQYRIKQIDFDGKSEFSAVRAVRGEGVSIKTVIYPNPSFDGKVNVVFEDASGLRDVSLMDMSGRIVRTWKGVSNNNLTIDNLNPGMYSLRITVKETGAQTVEKLVVNKR